MQTPKQVTRAAVSPPWSHRNLIAPLLLGTAVIVAIYLALPFAKISVGMIGLDDYKTFRSAGEAFLRGESPYHVEGFFSPLPTIWVFAILALLPPAFGYLWTLFPFVFLQLGLGRRAPSIWLFYPLLVHLRWGQLDGWLLLPILWLLQNRPVWGGIGAALLIFKPQVALGLLTFRLLGWIRSKDKANLGSAVAATLLLVPPAFAINPNWVIDWLQSLGTRVYYGGMKMSDVSAWSLTRGDMTGWLVFLLLAVAVAILLLRSKNRGAGALIAGIMFTPYLYVYDLVAVLPTVMRLYEGLILVAVSWLSYVLTVWLGGFAGAFLLVPLCALILSLRGPDAVHDADGGVSPKRQTLNPDSDSIRGATRQELPQ